MKTRSETQIIDVGNRDFSKNKPVDYEYYSVVGEPTAFYIYFETGKYNWGSSNWIWGDLNLWYELEKLSNTDKELFNQRCKELKEKYTKG